MILVTGGTGFVGQALVRHLVAAGSQVRILLRPSLESPSLPRGVPVEVAVCSLTDDRGLRAAMKGVDVVYHLAGAERRGSRADLTGVDVEGTRVVAQAAAQAGVDRFFFLSHLGADRASAYPVMKAKGLAEHFIQQSGVPYTIFRCSTIFGPNDQFTVPLSRLLTIAPGAFFMPGDGKSLLQPLWVEDVITCLTWALEDAATVGQLYSIGGPEYLTYEQVCEMILKTVGLRRWLVPFPPPYLRFLGLFMEQNFPRFPVSIFWLDYLAVDRTCAVDSLPRLFGLMPARLTEQMTYLRQLPKRGRGK